jgi:antitoxin VapB
VVRQTNGALSREIGIANSAGRPATTDDEFHLAGRGSKRPALGPGFVAALEPQSFHRTLRRRSHQVDRSQDEVDNLPMSVNIKDDETHRLIRQLAEATGETMTTAVKISVQERLARIRSHSPDERTSRLLAIGRSTAPRLKEPWRSKEHGELLYDESGLPT